MLVDLDRFSAWGWDREGGRGFTTESFMATKISKTGTELPEAIKIKEWEGEEESLPSICPDLSSIPRKLFPMMTSLESAAGLQLLHSRLLYRAFPQCTM